MTRIYIHTIQDAPEASRPLLEGLVQFSPTGKLLNLHAHYARFPGLNLTFETLRSEALPRGASRDLILKVAGEYGRDLEEVQL